MVFFVLTTAPQGGFGNYFLPIQIGAEDMAFPVLNMLSFWVTFVGFVVILAAIFFSGADSTIGPIGGWTGYAPLSALGAIAGPGQGMGMNLWITSIAIFCVGSLLGALNFITTLLNMRTRGMTLMRMPLTCWAWFTTAVLALLSFPVLLGGGILLLLDRLAGTSFFIPGGLYVSGILSGTNQTSFAYGGYRFFGSTCSVLRAPEVYSRSFPDGSDSHILSTSHANPSSFIERWSSRFCDRIIGFFVWGPHVHQWSEPILGNCFSVLTLSIGVPSAVKTLTG